MEGQSHRGGKREVALLFIHRCLQYMLQCCVLSAMQYQEEQDAEMSILHVIPATVPYARIGKEGTELSK